MIIMSITIQQSLRPLFLMCFIMGLGVYPIKQPTSRFQWIAYLSILYFLTIWLLYGYVLFCTFTTFSPKIFTHNITAMVVMVMINFTAITSAISTFYYHKRFQIYIKKVAMMDNTLEKLGTPKTYQKLRMLSKIMIIGWIMYTLIYNICETILRLRIPKQVSWRFLTIIHIFNYPVYIIEFTDLIFSFLLWYIGTRFDKLTDHLQCLFLKEKHGLIRKKPVIISGYFLRRRNYKQILWTIMHLYLELCCIARELNMIFGMQITFGMVLYFVWLTPHCYYTYRVLERINQDKALLLDIITVFKLLTCFIKFYAVNHICESVKNKANNVDKIIHQLTHTFRYADISNEMYFVVLQVMQHPLEFTGLGFFHLGNKFLQKFFSTIATFVIIMVQLNIYIL